MESSVSSRPPPPTEAPPPTMNTARVDRQPPPPPEEEYVPPPPPWTTEQTALQDASHSHLAVKATPTTMVRRMGERRLAEQNRDIVPKTMPWKADRPLGPPPLRERCVVTPPVDRRKQILNFCGIQSDLREFQTACEGAPALLKIFEKLMQIEGALEDAEDRDAALDSIEKWEAAAIKQLHEVLQ